MSTQQDHNAPGGAPKEQDTKTPDALPGLDDPLMQRRFDIGIALGTGCLLPLAIMGIAGFAIREILFRGHENMPLEIYVSVVISVIIAAIVLIWILQTKNNKNSITGNTDYINNPTDSISKMGDRDGTEYSLPFLLRPLSFLIMLFCMFLVVPFVGYTLSALWHSVSRR